MLAETVRTVVGLTFVEPAIARGEAEAVREQELTNLYVLAAHHGTGQALLERRGDCKLTGTGPS